MKRISVAVACLLTASQAVIPAEPADDAEAFGTQPYIYSAALSADGKRLVAVGPGTGTSTAAFVLELDGPKRGTITGVGQADGQPMRMGDCDWSALDRLVCSFHGTEVVETVLATVSRTLAVNADGSKPVQLGELDSARQTRVRQFDGSVIDWRNGVDGKVLMTRNNIPERTGNTRLTRTKNGLSVELIDTRNGRASTVEAADPDIIDYVSDGLGTVRLKVMVDHYEDLTLKGTVRYFYRTPDNRVWKSLGKGDLNEQIITPLAVDPRSNVAYVLQPLNGRQALYSITLNDTLESKLVFASDEVDVDDVVRIGRTGRVIGVTWTTDRRNVKYFDNSYTQLATVLERALPELPLIRFVSASADENRLLVWAGSDVDPGHLYVVDRNTQKLTDVFRWRPMLKGKTLSPVQAITYPASDGTQIPAYLTLPPGQSEAKGLPAIVMPHGGPDARDEWGFDWLAQYFAQRGFAVIQPNFRGSGGYGEKWFADNGFQSWKLAIGDVCDAGRWLVAQGMASPEKLAVFGWSYGGYAALQANVLTPDLFKAVVAVAPVTDLALLKSEAQQFTNRLAATQFIGDGPHIKEGSPASNAAAFVAPVLMFHGDKDVNVAVQQSQRMDRQLRDAGKSSELVVYPGLTHSLLDNSVRADMLRRSDSFLHRNLGIPE